MSPHIQYSSDDATGVATILLNRPERRNALFGTMRSDLLESIERAAESARVLVVRGAGGAFCAGGDVGFMAEIRSRQQSQTLASLVEQGSRVVSRIGSMSIPTIAAIEGVAAGAGLGLALACDFRLATENARLGASFARIGLSPDWGTSFFLTRMLGAARATDLLVSGRLVDANEAARLGLVSEVIEREKFDQRVGDVALRMASSAPASVAYIKRLIRDAQHLTLGEIMDREKEAQLACFETKDAEEGLNAFLEKRTPKFIGE